jgi:hypothetical protein
MSRARLKKIEDRLPPVCKCPHCGRVIRELAADAKNPWEEAVKLATTEELHAIVESGELMEAIQRRWEQQQSGAEPVAPASTGATIPRRTAAPAAPATPATPTAPTTTHGVAIVEEDDGETLSLPALPQVDDVQPLPRSDDDWWNR